MGRNSIRNMVAVSTLAHLLVLLAHPGEARASGHGCDEIPGLRYPPVEWRSVNGGRLPLSLLYRMSEDLLTILIEDGAPRNLAPDEMEIVLRTTDPRLWRKEISAVRRYGVTTATIRTEQNDMGPHSMRIRRAVSCTDASGVHTIVLKKADRVFGGLRMHDMYHFDVDHFWTAFGGKIVTITWESDNLPFMYPMRNRPPFAIAFDANPAAISWALPSDEKRISLFSNTDGPIFHDNFSGSAGWSREWLYPWNWTIAGPGAFSAATNSIDLFVRDEFNRVQHNRWNGTQWSWVTEPGLDDGEVTSSPAAVSWGFNRIDLVARGADYAVWHKVWDGVQWSGWKSLGGYVTSSPAIVSRGSNRLDVFARGGDSALWIRSWTGSAWTPWSSLGGVITSDPSAVVYEPGTVAVFARGGDMSIHFRMNEGAGWTDWQSLQGAAESAPAATSPRPGEIDVLVKGTDHHVFHQRSWRRATGWNDWAPVP